MSPILSRLFPIFVIVALAAVCYGLVMPVVVDAIISREDYLPSAVGSFLSSYCPDAEISFSNINTKKFVFDTALNITVSKPVFKNGGLYAGAKSLSITIPFTQLFTGHIKPSKVTLVALNIQHGSDGTIDNMLKSIQSYILSMPQIIIDGLSIHAGKIKYNTDSLLEVSHTLGKSILLKLNKGQDGNIKIAIITGKKTASLVGEFVNLAIKTETISLLTNGSIVIDCASGSLRGARIAVNKTKGTITLGSRKIQLNNLVADSELAGRLLNIRNLSLSVDGSIVGIQGDAEFNANFSHINAVNLKLSNTSLLPAYLLSGFLPDGVKNASGFLEGASIKIHPDSGYSISSSMVGVSFSFLDTSITDVNGKLTLNNNKLNLKVERGTFNSSTEFTNLILAAERLSDHWDLLAKGKIAISTKEFLAYIKKDAKVGLNKIDKSLQSLTENNFISNNIYPSFTYRCTLRNGTVEKKQMNLAVDKIEMRNLDLAGVQVKSATIDGNISQINNKIDLRIILDTGDKLLLSLDKKAHKVKIRAPIYMVDKVLNVDYLSKFSAGTVDIIAEEYKKGYKIKVDLKDAQLNIPLLRINNPKSANLAFLWNDSSINDVAFSTPTQSLVINKIAFNNSDVTFKDVVINNGDPLWVQVVKKNGKTYLNITGNSIKYADWDVTSISPKANTGGTYIDISTNKLIMHEGIVINQFRISSNDNQSGSNILELGGNLKGQGVYIRYNDGDINVSVGNAGLFLSGLGITKALEGGLFKMHGRFDDKAFTGSCDMTGARLLKTNVAVKLFSMASLTGLINSLEGSGILFNKIHIDYVVKDGDIRLLPNSSYAESESLGIQMRRGHFSKEKIDIEGVLSIVQAVDRAMRFIPFYGDLLTGGAGGGLLGFNFTLKGDANDPAISVNALSVLTPGGMKRIFDKQRLPTTSPSLLETNSNSQFIQQS